MHCQLVAQGFPRGSCLIRTGKRTLRACQVTLQQRNNQWYRLIKSAHLSRPEHYFSLYQSGCNHHCLKCHSWEFSQRANGHWVSPKKIGCWAREYEKKVTYHEPRESATMWQASELCRGCGNCLINGQRSPLCPGVLEPKDIVLSPQGFGPARNIFAFTGGDITCVPDFYCQAAEEIKKKCSNIWVLLESNGFGLTSDNLDRLKKSGVDSFWLDIKAYDREIYRKLCGVSNELVLEAPYEIMKRGFGLEVLTLYLPGWVEDDEIVKIAELLSSLDAAIPFTILAFFPAYKMKKFPPPDLADMVRVYQKVKERGLTRVKLGNCGVFTKTSQDWEYLIREIGREGVG